MPEPSNLAFNIISAATMHGHQSPASAALKQTIWRESFNYTPAQSTDQICKLMPTPYPLLLPLPHSYWQSLAHIQDFVWKTVEITTQIFSWKKKRIPHYANFIPWANSPFIISCELEINWVLEYTLFCRWSPLTTGLSYRRATVSR